MRITDCNLYIDGEFMAPYWIDIGEGKIKDFGPMTEQSTDGLKREQVSVKGAYVVPGFIDQHIHGALGYDFMDGSHDAIHEIAHYLPREGVTSILATTTTSDEGSLERALKCLGNYERDGGAEILGIHLEGPYLSSKAAGAHRKELFVAPSIGHFRRLQDFSNDRIKMVTLAVENDANFELIKYLDAHGIVPSVGHTVATYDETCQAVIAGCKCATHCYNAMTGLHHREPGVVGAVLTNDQLKAELIVDGVHVHDQAVKLLDQLKNKEDIILITDAMRAKGLPAGHYDLGGQQVYSDGQHVKTRSGNLAGSILTLNNALKNYQEITQSSLKDILPMITENPAKLLGVFNRKGSIEIGKDADLVVLTPQLEIVTTYCNGEEVYRSNDIVNHR